jgi:hypothetical protein
MVLFLLFAAAVVLLTVGAAAYIRHDWIRLKRDTARLANDYVPGTETRKDAWFMDF